MSPDEPALFRRFPALAARIPRVPLVTSPTPVERMPRLEAMVGTKARLYVKRDDLTASPYGGNKPRKLEFLLGDARARRQRRLVTFGVAGSNHVRATAIYGRLHGFEVTAILVPQPPDPRVGRNVQAIRAEGARVIAVPSTAHAGAAAAIAVAWTLARTLRPPYVIPPGGSSPVGSLGYVSAGLELADQIARGECPEPAAIFVAGGSNGTAAGLLVGLRLAGLRSRLVVVWVDDLLAVSPRAIASLANRIGRLIGRLGCPAPRVGPEDLTFLDGYIGRGFGWPTIAGGRATAQLAEAHGLTLDPDFTSKTAAAFLDAAIGRSAPSSPLLYWHTYGGKAHTY